MTEFSFESENSYATFYSSLEEYSEIIYDSNEMHDKCAATK